MTPLLNRIATVGALLSIGLAGGCATAPELILDAGLHQPTLRGSLALSNTAVTDFEEIDLGTELDLDSTDAAPFLRGELDLGAIDFSAWGFKTSASGDGTVTADFGNIAAGSQVESELDLTLAQGRVLFDLVEFAGLEIGAGLAAQWIDVTLDVDETTFNLSESVEVRQAVPLVAARAGYDFGALLPLPVSVELSAAAVRASIGEIDGAVLDLEALARARFGLLGVFVGWRLLDVEIDGTASDQNFSGDVELSGFLFGATLRF